MAVSNLQDFPQTAPLGVKNPLVYHGCMEDRKTPEYFCSNAVTLAIFGFGLLDHISSTKFFITGFNTIPACFSFCNQNEIPC